MRGRVYDLSMNLSNYWCEQAGYTVIPFHKVRSISEATKQTIHDTEIALLEDGIVPLRYIGTVRFFGISNILRLRRATVALVGCGGVGGFVCEQLARLGIGTLNLVDGDIFDETNLNRQLLCEEATIGINKALVAQARVGKINPGVTVHAHPVFVNKQNVQSTLIGCDCVVDAVDSIEARFVLVDSCREMQIPLVHGAIGNASCRLMDVREDYEVFSRLYSLSNENDMSMGNPVVTVSICAALMAGEVIKLVCNIGQPLINQMMHIEWLNNSNVIIEL